LAIGFAALAGVSCRLSNASPANYTGPSEFGVSVSLSATPDLLARDGRQTSTITVQAHDSNGAPLAQLGVALGMSVESASGTLGSLSQTQVTTGADGRASVVYTAPLPATLGQSNNATVQIFALPIGTNSANATFSGVTLRLVGATSGSGAAATFVYGPRSPKMGDTILFDASQSAPTKGASIIAYAWDFGDGNASPRVPYIMSDGPTITHEYNKTGTFTVGLTIIDSAGNRSTATIALTIADQ
jgi:PKD repeat protein